MITLAAQAALAANDQVIRVLRLIGATDAYIARAFVRRFALRALAGATTGTALGLLAVAALPQADIAGGFLTGLGFQGGQWAFPLLIPVSGGGRGACCDAACRPAPLEGTAMRFAWQWVKSLVFTAIIYLAMVPIALAYLPWTIASRKGAVAAAHAWTGFVLWLLPPADRAANPGSRYAASG